MRENLHHDYLKLIQDARLFIQNRGGAVRSFEKEKSEGPLLPRLIPTPTSHQKEKGPKLEDVSNVQIPSEPLPLLPKRQKPQEIKESTQSGWDLQPMGEPEADATFHNKLAFYTKMCDPIISALLVLPAENPAHRLFLENVSRAITRTFAPASVVLYHDRLLRDCSYKLFLAPLSLLKKTFLHAQPHQFFKLESSTVIPLEDLDLYEKDVNSKRALWNTIQLSFQS